VDSVDPEHCFEVGKYGIVKIKIKYAAVALNVETGFGVDEKSLMNLDPKKVSGQICTTVYAGRKIMCKTCSVVDPRSEISAFLTPDPVWEKIRLRDPRSGINISNHISDCPVIIFWVKNTYNSSSIHPGWKNPDSGSGISIPDSHHFSLLT
jgi:hypothetical protein